MIFALDFGAPRLRMNAQPCFAFRLPLSAQIMRHGIGKSKCNEIHCALLLPMRQAIRSKTHLCVRIEETWLSHGRPSVPKRVAAPKAPTIRVGSPTGTVSNPFFCDGGLETAAP